ncbi:MAG: GNAT family N-acetyltransferase [Bacteroidota bacterium]
MEAKNKQLYRDLCARQKDIPLFMQPWWLDHCCGANGWSLCLSRDKGGKIRGVLPYYLTHRWGLRMISNPILSPYLGVHFNYPEGLEQTKRRYAFEHKVLKDLIQQVPKVHYFSQTQPIHFTNHLAFYWSKFRQRTYYTYLFDAPIDLNKRFEGMSSAVRNKIRKAEKQLKVHNHIAIDRFYSINQQSFDRQGMRMPYSLALLRGLDRELGERAQREVMVAEDEQGRAHAAIYLVWDEQYVYNLMLGADVVLRNSGAVQLLLWKGIQWAAKMGLAFDFEGSMDPRFASVFTAFGPRQQAYHHIYRFRYAWMELIWALRKKGGWR